MVSSYLIVFLIKILLMTGDVKHFFMCLGIKIGWLLLIGCLSVELLFSMYETAVFQVDHLWMSLSGL